MYTRPHGTSSGSQNGSREVRAATHASGPALAAGPERGGSGPPRRRASPVGEPLGQAVGPRRTPGLEASGPRGSAAAFVGGGAPTHRAGSAAWAGGSRVPHESVDGLARGRSDRTRMRREVFHRPRLASPPGLGLEPATTRRPSTGTERTGHPPVATRTLAGAKKNAQKRGQTIVFVDESGLSERPHRVRTWAIGSHLCSALLSDLVSRRHPCSSLSLHVHHVVKRTCTS